MTDDECLLNSVRFLCNRDHTGAYAGMPAEQQLALYLTHLAVGNQQASLSREFECSKSTVRRSILRVSSALIVRFRGMIRLPTDAEARAAAQFNLERYHFPRSAACMDGTHIATGGIPKALATGMLNHKEGSQAFIAHAVVLPKYV